MHLMASFSPLFPGLTAGDTIFTYQGQLSGNEGESVTMKCNYQTDYTFPELHWFKQSNLQAPQFILWKGAKSQKSEYIPDNRYESRTTEKSTELIITKLTLADTALYYCRLYKNLKTDMDYSSKRREVVFKAQLHIRWILFIPSSSISPLDGDIVKWAGLSSCSVFNIQSIRSGAVVSWCTG
uniref:Ig-like domain-containing protein n=1 Tax=Oryzias melastigma TaxID=30732 RepID=A0A3B3B8A3_ORYME